MAGDARGMTPRDLTRIRLAGDPQIAPDGSRVAFVVTTLSEERDEYRSNIWVAPVPDGWRTSDGAAAALPEARRFTTGDKRDTFPRWSPDGTQLAFVSEREPKKKGQLYVMPAGGGEPTRLTDVKEGVSNPVWSPDGTRLAFQARTGGWQEPESEEERAKSKPARVITTLKYRLNGEGFIYDRPTHVFVVSADGSAEPKQITSGDCADSDPVWSPDGRWIAFVSARHETRDEDDVADVWLVSPEGGEPRRITDSAGPLKLPVFSPDGRTVAFLGHRYPRETGRNMLLYTVAVPAGESESPAAPVGLTAQLDRTCAPYFANFRPLWTADGAWLLFAVEDQGDIPVYRVAPGGDGVPERVIAGERQVTGLSCSADGQAFAFTATDPVSPAEVFVCRAGGQHERRLTDLNREWRAEVALSRPERFRYERAGHTLDCWVMKPHGYEEGKRYPALLNIHGGPATQYGHTFFDEFQVYAGAGYAVIFTNPRGSQGYGEAFTRAVVQDWGGGDYQDVMAGVDEALRRCSFLDPEQLGVMGGSYGGYMTSWIVGHTNRFKAACSERALNDFTSMFGTSDIGHSFPREHVGVYPWEDREEYVRHSPLTYARDVATPLLIMHAENDLRCPIEQAEQLYVHLKKLGKDVVFVRVPDESHELSRSGKPRHRIERFELLLDWFGVWLRGEAPSRSALRDVAWLAERSHL